MDYQLGPGPLQVDQNTIDEKIKGDIGIVENGDVATHAITNGYYVIWKGDLYIAKTDISSGTTLSAASSGNLTAKPSGLGAEVAALNSNLTPVVVETGIAKIRAEKMGKLVILHLYVDTALETSTTTWVVVGVLPESLRPKYGKSFVCFDNGASADTNLPVQTRITNDGSIQVWLWANTSVKPFGTIVYFTA